MKNFFKFILSFINKIGIIYQIGSKSLKDSTFYLVKLRTAQNNLFKLYASTIEKSSISVDGIDNILEFQGVLISSSTITVEGNNNRIVIKNGVLFRSSSLIIRGENCTVNIDTNTTFGGIRIVNVGENNAVNIGKDCLFSDHIELWASDTHSIFNENGYLINPEKPVNIGNKVWVGSRAIILKGVTIDDGSIVGMGAVVTKDIPKNVVSAGFPNKTIRENVYWELDYKS
jgi:acetyltransferase-like isoleucine patch superfamily enzyme